MRAVKRKKYEEKESQTGSRLPARERDRDGDGEKEKEDVTGERKKEKNSI